MRFKLLPRTQQVPDSKGLTPQHEAIRSDARQCMPADVGKAINLVSALLAFSFELQAAGDGVVKLVHLTTTN